MLYDASKKAGRVFAQPSFPHRCGGIEVEVQPVTTRQVRR